MHAADLGFELRRADSGLALHEACQAFLLDVLRHRIGERVRGRARDRRIGEGADAVELRRIEEIEQLLEFRFGLSRESDDEGRADGELRAGVAPARDPLQRPVDGAGPLHQLEDARAGVLERDVEVRQQLSLRHQRDDVVDVRIRVDVMQPRPQAELGQAFA